MQKKTMRRHKKRNQKKRKSQTRKKQFGGGMSKTFIVQFDERVDDFEDNWRSLGDNQGVSEILENKNNEDANIMYLREFGNLPTCIINLYGGFHIDEDYVRQLINRVMKNTDEYEDEDEDDIVAKVIRINMNIIEAK